MSRECDLGPIIGDVRPRRAVPPLRRDGPDPLPGIVLGICAAVGATILATLLGAMFWLVIASVRPARADEAMVRVPSACVALATRFDIPLELTREQAAAALIAINTLQSDDRDVRRCRAAIKTGEKR